MARVTVEDCLDRVPNRFALVVLAAERARQLSRGATAGVDCDNKPAVTALRERLIISIDGKGAFRRFKDVLLAYPAERERWFAYRADLLHWHIQNWLEGHEIVPENAPPWGAVAAPQELPTIGRPVAHGTEAPGELLRRQARDLIETIPAIELPTAIAFLEFLKQRSLETLAKHAAEHDPTDHDPADLDDQVPATAAITVAPAVVGLADDA